ncbi:MAG TPA: response regulator [Gammaproteobacteria bacterium]|nr:response regulator [Gammaproteobacteria bacterium]
MPRDGHILLVEDSPQDVELIMLALKEGKVVNHIDVVKDGPEALAYLTGRGDHAGRDLPSVVLLDINLPKMSGLDVLKEIRANLRTRHVPVVMLTSSRQQEDMLRSYDLGANSFVRKPVEFDKLVDAMQQLRLYWLLLNELPYGEAAGG